MGRIRRIINIRIIGFQGFGIGLRVDEDQTADLAPDHVEFPTDSKDAVPTLKEELVLIRPADLARYVLHHSINGSKISTDADPQGLLKNPML